MKPSLHSKEDGMKKTLLSVLVVAMCLVLAAPLFADIRERPDFRAAMEEQQAILERQRLEVLDILCGTEPLPESLRPQPATCAGH